MGAVLRVQAPPWGGHPEWSEPQPQGEKDPCRTATVLTKQSLTQQILTTTLGLDRLSITPRRQDTAVAPTAPRRRAHRPLCLARS